MAPGVQAFRAAAVLMAAAALSVTMAACGSLASRNESGARIPWARCQAGLRQQVAGWRAGPAWIITPGALTHLSEAGLPPAVLAEFNRPATLLLSAHDRTNRLAPRASLAFYFTNASKMDAAIRQHRIPGNVRYLVLDLERWLLTPVAQQERPIQSLRLAVAAARAAGKCVVFTPALDLLAARHIFGSASSPGLISDFDRLIIGPAARLGDIVEVQAQQAEGSPAAGSLTSAAVTVSRGASSRSAVFVGLSTNPDGRHVTPGDLLSLYRSGRSAGATGYWLNIAESSPECPRCGAPQTQVAVAFLETLARTRWTG